MGVDDLFPREVRAMARVWVIRGVSCWPAMT